MKHGSLFSGIGGFDLAAEWIGWKNIFQVEIDERCQRLLKQNFPNGARYGNIKEFDGTKYRGTIDVLSGGPPCQPASLAGKRQGEKDDRWLWPEAIRVFGEIRPRIGFFENPDDLLTLDNGEPFERICSALENFGYKVETYGLPAACVGAWHERDRIWIIAYANDISNTRELDNRTTSCKTKRGKGENQIKGETLDGQRIWIKPHTEVETISNVDSQRLQKPTCGKLRSIFETNGTSERSKFSGTHAEVGAYWQTEPGVVRMVHGLPDRVDRIKELGNAVVPQVVFEFYKAINVIL